MCHLCTNEMYHVECQRCGCLTIHHYTTLDDYRCRYCDGTEKVALPANEEERDVIRCGYCGEHMDTYLDQYYEVTHVDATTGTPTCIAGFHIGECFERAKDEGFTP